MKTILLICLSTMLTFINVANASAAVPAIASSAEQVTPLLNGQTLPNVMTTTISGKQVPLSSLTKGKKTILFFYRGGWCPFCNTQMGQLKILEPKLIKLGFQLIGISTDSVEDLAKSVKKHQLNYTLVSDYYSSVSQAFGLAFFTAQATTDRYLAKMQLTNPLQKNAQGDERLVMPVPAIYVVDAEGLVQFNYVNPNYKVRLNAELLLKAAQLVQ